LPIPAEGIFEVWAANGPDALKQGKLLFASSLRQFPPKSGPFSTGFSTGRVEKVNDPLLAHALELPAIFVARVRSGLFRFSTARQSEAD
jgi:hypothetical protein